jgi:hypothetical protein
LFYYLKTLTQTHRSPVAGDADASDASIAGILASNSFSPFLSPLISFVIVLSPFVLSPHTAVVAAALATPIAIVA